MRVDRQRTAAWKPRRPYRSFKSTEIERLFQTPDDSRFARGHLGRQSKLHL